MKSMLAIGECMMELIPEGDDLFKKAYAGDTYNALVYAKRSAGDISAKFFSAIGVDSASDAMAKKWQYEGVDTSCVLKSNDASIGVYSISTDSAGERSFSYWRANSAATQMMTLLSESSEQAPAVDYVFFSGISLAILTDDDKQRLIEFIASLRAQGSRVAFDPNYRPKMWRDAKHAIYWLEQAYQNSDIVLPGDEEHMVLFGHNDYQDIASYCYAFGVDEIVIKCGDSGTYVMEGSELSAHQPFIPAPVQVDSTAAGDSFAGTYLAQRLIGKNCTDALSEATRVAGIVVQHQGAIIKPELHAAN